jgi:cytochrome c-type biogenesis protein
VILSLLKKISFLSLIGIGVFLILASFYDDSNKILAQEFLDAPYYQATDLNGSTVVLSDYENKVVLINLWATWCEPCREEMPSLQKLQDMFDESEFQVIGVSIDESGSENSIRQFLASKNISYTVWQDPSNIFQFAFRTIGVPESFLINQEGQIVYRWKGAFDPVSESNVSLVHSVVNGQEMTTPQNTLLENGFIAAAVIAFSAGVLSFLSPCVLPLIPVYASLITGLSVKELSETSSSKERAKLRFSATNKGILFVVGFSIIFILLGTTVAFLGNLFMDATVWIERIGGVILIALGIHMVGFVRIPFLERQFRMELGSRNSGKFGPMIVGMAFAAGWTPCIGPILAGILTIAASSSSVALGAGLLGVYSVGLAIPFLISAIAIDRFMIFFQRICLL